MDDGYAVLPDRVWYETDHKLLEAFRAAGGLSSHNLHKVQDEALTANRSRLCYGPTDINALDFDYTARFFEVYEGVRRFAVVHTISCHEESMKLMAAADRHVADMLRRLRGGGHLRRTAVVLMGDHGAILSNYYYSHLGATEYKMPLMDVLLPRSFVRAHPDAVAHLRGNQRRLTTNYDMYETVRHLLTTFPAPHKVTSVGAWHASARQYDGADVHTRIFVDGYIRANVTHEWSYSLLQNDVPATRTCNWLAKVRLLGR